MFLNYKELCALAEQQKELRIKKEVIDGVECELFNYTVNLSTTFNNPLAKEFRGLVYINGKCAARPFPKFFNLGERPDVNWSAIDWENAEYYNKHDGSLAIPVLINGKIRWKTQKTFYSDQAIAIQNFYDKNKNSLEAQYNITQQVILGVTPLFEYVGPDNQIVIHYKEENLIFLGNRDIHSGRITMNQQNKNYSADYSSYESEEGIEGYVVWDGNQLVKLKSKWYLDRHKIFTEFNPKVVIEKTLDETVDDLIGYASQLGADEKVKMILAVSDETLKYKMEIEELIDEKYLKYKDIESQKDFAIAINSSCKEISRFLFMKRAGKDYSEALNKFIFNNILSILNRMDSK